MNSMGVQAQRERLVRGRALTCVRTRTHLFGGCYPLTHFPKIKLASQNLNLFVRYGALQCVFVHYRAHTLDCTAAHRCSSSRIAALLPPCPPCPATPLYSHPAHSIPIPSPTPLHSPHDCMRTIIKTLLPPGCGELAQQSVK
jgi:hypothetical protein